MPKVAQARDFFVVGGPVQPDRACYVERAADAELVRGIGEQRFCYVLSARSTGKSSMMARAIRSLRQEGQLAAVIDLNQIGSRGEGSDAGRWYYGIAYRVLRELRVKVDLQAWWQEKGALPAEQRLAEFFWEIVLANTSVPVTVFFDEIERVLDLPFAQELFAMIHACYSRRVSEPDYARLNFVVLGVASPSTLCPEANLSPFIDGQSIDPADFTLEQTLTLAPGFGVRRAEARELLERVYDWTSGQPYLTQKVARGVARKGSKPEDVDRLVREQFFAPGAAEKEPYLSHIRALLTASRSRARQALALLGKIAKGAPVGDELRSPPRELLRLSGVAAAGADGLLKYRNRIIAEVFADRWVRAARPFDWRGAGAVAALVAVATIVPLWYSQYLPRPYIRTLSVVTQDFAVAEDAYEKLHRLPGFARRADRLLAEAMARRSRESDNYDEVLSADQVLRRLPEQEWLADQLKADYWLRRADHAMHAERRDEALLFAMRALPGQEAAVRRVAGQLIGDDYRRLMGTFRFPAAPVRWEVDWAEGRLAVVDPAHRAERLPLDAAKTQGDSGTLEPVRLPGRLTALQHVPVKREISVEEIGSAGAFRLQLRVQHSGADDLMLTLAAPSGASATIPLTEQSPGQEIYSFSATGGSPFVALADEAKQGVWRFTLVDRQSGGVGALLRWGLQFSETGEEWQDSPEQGIAVPDPVRTEQVRIDVTRDGRHAVAYPSRAGSVGALAIWNLVEGRLLRDLKVRAAPDHVAFNADGTRLLVQSGDVLTLWDVKAGTEVASLETQTEFLLPPALSVDGEFVAIAEQVEGAPPLFSLVRVEDGALVASTEGIEEARSWAVGPQARYVAVLESPRVVSVVDPRRGNALRELRHERDVVRLLPVPAGDMLLTVDADGGVRAWRLPVDGTGAQPGDNWRLGVTVAEDSVSVSADGSMAAFEAEHGQVVVRDVGGELRPLHLRIDPAGRLIETALSPDGSALVTANGGAFRMWRLDGRELEAGLDPELSALALDAGGAVAALGFRGGHVRVRSASELARAELRSETVDYIGHRGMVTSLDINAPRSRVASGGDDGVVRAWDLASVAPAEHFMRHPAGPVYDVDVSPDGRWIASAAEYSARLWRAGDGMLAGELPVNGTALSVSFSPDSTRWAVGDSAGNVFVAEVAAPEESAAAEADSVRAQGAVRTIAFAPDGRLLASGDDTGNVEFWDAVSFVPVGERHAFAHPVRWIGFANSGRHVVVQTDHWMHRAELVSGKLELIASRLLEVGLEAGAAFVSPDGERLRVIGGLGSAALAFHELGLDGPDVEPLPASSPLLKRDWTAALGLRVDAAGEVVAVSR